ncbi:hypothetical protein H5410_027994 [Solanum commersonii]|uniref:Uncharacterized protein n=1 Tax=Solanum commersonii TaxID=4109 RepID=A0A9J5Z659_SOLCO|nr:hypothetical protein H5410_027994 [Solanum commersonii]
MKVFSKENTCHHHYKTCVLIAQKVAPAPSASQLCKTKVQFLSDPQRLRRVAGGFFRVVKISRLRLSPEKIGEDIAKKTVKNRKGFQVL